VHLQVHLQKGLSYLQILYFHFLLQIRFLASHCLPHFQRTLSSPHYLQQRIYWYQVSNWKKQPNLHFHQFSS
jgi:hypothetical protein